MADDPPGAAHPVAAPRPSGRRRVAAAVALLSIAAAVGVVVLGALRNPGQLVLALALVVVAALAGWSALLRRGVLRLLGAALAVAALAGLLLLLDTASLTRAVVVTGLVIVSTAGARAAIGTDLAEAPRDAHRVPAARHGVLILNPRSGGGAVERHGLVEAARTRGITPVVLQAEDDLRALAEAAVADGADVIGMAGGDGSQALVADVARRHDVPLVCVPAGTRNHFALDLGLDREKVAAALDAYGEAVERSIDLATLGDRVFVNNASLGVYATVVQSSDYREAKLATTTRLLPALVGPHTEGFDLRFDGPDGAHHATADLVLVSNNPYRLDVAGGAGSRPRLDTGVLGVVTVTVERRPGAGQQTAGTRRGVRQWTTPEFVVDSGELLIDVGVDGEALKLAPPLRFRVLPGALRVRMPPNAPGWSPAALRSESPLAALRSVLRVLRGRPVR